MPHGGGRSGNYGSRCIVDLFMVLLPSDGFWCGQVRIFRECSFRALHSSVISTCDSTSSFRLLAWLHWQCLMPNLYWHSFRFPFCGSTPLTFSFSWWRPWFVPALGSGTLPSHLSSRCGMSSQAEPCSGVLCGELHLCPVSPCV